MKLKLIGIALLTFVIYSCASKSAAVANKPTEVVKPVAFAEGKNLYENNCAKCHKLFDAKERTQAEWKPILVSMQKKARLDDVQITSISDYINSQL